LHQTLPQIHCFVSCPASSWISACTISALDEFDRLANMSFNGNVEFTHVVFAEAIFIPAHTFEQWHTGERHIEAYFPFRVEILAY